MSTIADEVPSVRVGGRRERGTLVAACLSVALAQLCLTLPVALNGEIQQTFRTSAAQLAWVTTAFVLPTAGLIGSSANFHLTFVVPVVLGVVMVVVNRVLVVDSRAPAGRALDWPGQISLALVWFVIAELRSPSPMLRLQLLRIPRFAARCWSR